MGEKVYNIIILLVSFFGEHSFLVLHQTSIIFLRSVKKGHIETLTAIVGKLHKIFTQP